jgi:hypothetical protein
MGSFPALDMCLRARGASEDAPVADFAGPVLRANGLPEGLLPGQMSSYFSVAPGAYDLRAVAGGATDCATQLNVSTHAALSELNAGEYRTLVVVGTSGRLLFRVQNLLDEPTGSARVRLVSTALPSPTLSVGLGTGESFVPWISGVPSVSIGSPPETDANGYAHVSPVSGQTLSLRAGQGGAQIAYIPDFQLAEGDAVTFFGRASAAGAFGFGLVTCYDLDESSAPLASCSVALSGAPPLPPE